MTSFKDDNPAEIQLQNNPDEFLADDVEKDLIEGIENIEVNEPTVPLDAPLEENTKNEDLLGNISKEGDEKRDTSGDPAPLSKEEEEFNKKYENDEIADENISPASKKLLLPTDVKTGEKVDYKKMIDERDTVLHNKEYSNYQRRNI
jgi:hypothetical protein